jgi:ATP-binding cassette subfamily F protein 3
VLQAALAGYDGTLIMVSHDRYLIDAMATAIWEIRDGVLHVFKGGYGFYRQRQQEEALAQEQDRTRVKAAGTTRPGQRRPVSQGRAATEDHRARQEDILVREISALEEEVAALETGLAEASYGQDHQRIAELHAQHKLKSRLLQEKMDLWASLERSP